MGAVSGQGTTFNLPNYHGVLIEVTPSDTPLLSISGGLSGGGETTDTKTFEWQTVDMRDPQDVGRLEGANAPTATARSRSNVTNNVQIFHEAVETSYTKQATTGEYATAGAAPFVAYSGAPNPVGSEHSFQVMTSLKQIARDINYSFWYGVKTTPTDNATARKSGGLLPAITSNLLKKKALTVDADSATDTITPDAAHDLVVGSRVVFTDVGASALVKGKAYWVTSVSTTVSFKIALTSGGSAITVGTAVLSYYPLLAANTLAVADVNSLLQSVFENGGIKEQDTAVLLVAPGQRTRLTAAYADANRKADPFAGTRDIAGLAVDTIITDFGRLAVVTDRMAPADAVTVVSAEQLAPVFLNIPGKGFLFEEALAKVGSADRSQLYGEIGFKYGNQASHGTYRGFYPAA